MERSFSSNFFLTCLVGVNEVDYCRYPAQEIQLQWLCYYVEAQKGTQRGAASHFFWALWALIQNQFSTTSFDFLR
ncbi:Ethanolamine kinase 2 [Lemmus lemmus]